MNGAVVAPTSTLATMVATATAMVATATHRSPMRPAWWPVTRCGLAECPEERGRGAEKEGVPTSTPPPFPHPLCGSHSSPTNPILGSSPSWLKANELFNKKQDYKGAAEMYSKAIVAGERESYADLHVLYSNRSLMRLKLSNPEGALEDAEKCVELKPDFPVGCTPPRGGVMLTRGV